MRSNTVANPNFTLTFLKLNFVGQMIIYKFRIIVAVSYSWIGFTLSEMINSTVMDREREWLIEVPLR